MPAWIRTAGMIALLAGCASPNDATAEPPIRKAPAEETVLAQAPGGAAKSKVPDVFKVKFETTKGDFVIEVHREWAPNGADHIHELVSANYYDGCKFFRVVPGFMVQFGIHGDPAIGKKWKDANIKDDKVMKSNKPGMVTYAQTSLPNSRSTQIFVNFGDNSFLDNQRFAPFGEVISGMDVVKKINAEYGERPDQGRMHSEGDAYLKKSFPNLDMIKKVSFVE